MTYKEHLGRNQSEKERIKKGIWRSEQYQQQERTPSSLNKISRIFFEINSSYFLTTDIQRLTPIKQHPISTYEVETK